MKPYALQYTGGGSRGAELLTRGREALQNAAAVWLAVQRLETELGERLLASSGRPRRAHCTPAEIVAGLREEVPEPARELETRSPSCATTPPDAWSSRQRVDDPLSAPHISAYRRAYRASRCRCVAASRAASPAVARRDRRTWGHQLRPNDSRLTARVIYTTNGFVVSPRHRLAGAARCRPRARLETSSRQRRLA